MSKFIDQRPIEYLTTIKHFEKFIYSGIDGSKFNDVFMSTFSSTGPGPSDPRLLLYVFDFIRENNLNKESIVEFVSQQQYHYLWGHYIENYIENNTKYHNITSILIEAIHVWKSTPQIFLRIFQKYCNSEAKYFKVLYIMLLTASTEKYVDILLETYLYVFETIDAETLIGNVINAYISLTCYNNYYRCNIFETTIIKPNIELYVHKKLLHDPKYCFFKHVNTNLMLRGYLNRYISERWKHNTMHLQEFIDVLHVYRGLRIPNLINDLVVLNNDKLTLIWIKNGVRDDMSNDIIIPRNIKCSHDMWFAIRELKAL